MKTLSAQCVILGHKNFGENDKLIFLYIKELGKIKAIAKGARKMTSKFTGHLETMNFCNTSLYFGPRNIIITEIVATKNFKLIRENFEKLSTALKIAEISNKLLMESQQIDTLIDLLEETLTYLEKCKNPELVSYSYLIKMLHLVGFFPDLKSIHTNIDIKYLKFLNFLKTSSLKEIENIQIQDDEKIEIDKILSNFMEYAS